MILMCSGIAEALKQPAIWGGYDRMSASTSQHANVRG